MRLFILVFAGLLVLLQHGLWMTDGGLREVWQLEAALSEQTEINRSLASRNAALEAEVLDLKQGLDAVEERARAELGMVREDETFYQITPYRDDRRP